MTCDIEDSVYSSGQDPTKFASLVESTFKTNLMRKYNQVQYLKQEIANQQRKNEANQRVLEA